MQHDQDRSANGYAFEDIAQTAYAVWCRCSGITVEWDDLPDKTPWLRLAEKAVRTIDEFIRTESALSKTFLAKKLFQWAYGIDDELCREQWAGLMMHDLLAWEAVGRHLINCLDSEAGSVQMAEHENKIVAWFHGKMKSQGVSV